MRILVLGGSGFAGRAVAAEAVARGCDVTVLNRGRRDPVPGVRQLTGDRLTADGLRALDGGRWDAVVDTWSADARAVELAAAALAGRAGHYTYVSSRSVYHYDENPSPASSSPGLTAGAPGGASWADAPALTEDAPLVAADDPGYAGDKLRGEQAAEHFGGPLLLARAGLILGPHEDVGRLPWWLRRLQRGGPTLAPGPRDLPLQYIDVRDLAAFVLDAAAAGRTGPYTVVNESGHTTMGELLGIANEVTGGHADLRWTAPEAILDAGIEPWTQLPIWLPPGPLYAFMHRGDVSRATAAGLRCRPVRDTVADTWSWLADLPGPAPLRTDRPPVGLSPEAEATLL
ncbi:putative NAD-dependent epimerase/dehydratase [Actinoplanes missouriensis 431]|uniref:Putative NAD-dependent epimerase/dehydratase n=1 Tax=Actinoplanes missouriensis (strain ATCC 14538 / DSM 43046 / CBS 188.64 / JCM 3121 / NBRC 102363 / NCIMB 12654 / NRRL B-3342 / UNCC 431) TaxID=512565 RepID=I0H8Q7_ACTM4|nr:NAD-dependent epimerase/dehydratase family protein [Actinoplanes missouriensis]BAL89394.1 putative NAD-dependent epimerase/dehydratase [Actinoplanes missouriensis 431]